MNNIWIGDLDLIFNWGIGGLSWYQHYRYIVQIFVFLWVCYLICLETAMVKGSFMWVGSYETFLVCFFFSNLFKSVRHSATRETIVPSTHWRLFANFIRFFLILFITIWGFVLVILNSWLYFYGKLDWFHWRFLSWFYFGSKQLCMRSETFYCILRALPFWPLMFKCASSTGWHTMMLNVLT